MFFGSNVLVVFFVRMIMGTLSRVNYGHESCFAAGPVGFRQSFTSDVAATDFFSAGPEPSVGGSHFFLQFPNSHVGRNEGRRNRRMGPMRIYPGKFVHQNVPRPNQEERQKMAGTLAGDRMSECQLRFEKSSL